jgi:hypothetical protein
MKINHRGRDIGVSHTLLHRADINALLEKVGGEAMTERVKAGRYGFPIAGKMRSYEPLFL